MHIDNKLSFNHHVSNLCKRANQKLSALLRLGKFYNLAQRRLLMKSFIESQFGYSPLTWMFHDRGINHKINRVHERSLRFVYTNEALSFEELLELDKSHKIHHRNIHSLAIEMFKVIKGVSSEIMNNIFIQRNTLNVANTRSMHSNPFLIPRVNTVHYGHDSLRYFGPKIWGIIPEEIKSCESVAKFKSAIKSWIPDQCPCRLCADYLPGVGYI